MNKNTQRDVSIDLIKGMGIFCMVAGHCGSPITKFIYLFHMAIFFIASGYCFKESNSESLESVICFVKRKFKTLWFPYVLWTAIFSFCHNFFIHLNIYTDNPLLLKYVSGKNINITGYWSLMDIMKNIIKACLLNGHTQMGGAFWFIATLLELSIAYCFIDYIAKKILKKGKNLVVQGGIALIFLLVGFGCYLLGHSFAGLDKVFSYYILFYCGYLFKKYNLSSRDRTTRRHIIILVITFITLIICNNIGTIELNQNKYVNPFYFLIVSFMGWQLLYEISFWVKKMEDIKKIIVCMGQNTLAVVIFHFLCFKIVSYIGVLAKGEPLCLVAAFPVLYRGGLWWMAYLCVGLTIPICWSLIWKKIKKNTPNYIDKIGLSKNFN